jgi:hypothetical protein
VTRTRNADLANTRLLWRFEQPRPLRKQKRRQAEPVRPIYDHAVPWPITIGEQRTEWPHCGLLVTYTLVIGLVACAAVWWGNYWG